MATATQSKTKAEPNRVVALVWEDTPPVVVHVAATPELAAAWAAGFNYAKQIDLEDWACDGTAATFDEVLDDPKANGIFEGSSPQLA
jgi:hypothetical protein